MSNINYVNIIQDEYPSSPHSVYFSEQGKLAVTSDDGSSYLIQDHSANSYLNGNIDTHIPDLTKARSGFHIVNNNSLTISNKSHFPKYFSFPSNQHDIVGILESRPTYSSTYQILRCKDITLHRTLPELKWIPLNEDEVVNPNLINLDDLSKFHLSGNDYNNSDNNTVGKVKVLNINKLSNCYSFTPLLIDKFDIGDYITYSIEVKTTHVLNLKLELSPHYQSVNHNYTFKSYSLNITNEWTRISVTSKVVNNQSSVHVLAMTLVNPTSLLTLEYRNPKVELSKYPTKFIKPEVRIHTTEIGEATKVPKLNDRGHFMLNNSLDIMSVNSTNKRVIDALGSSLIFSTIETSTEYHGSTLKLVSDNFIEVNTISQSRNPGIIFKSTYSSSNPTGNIYYNSSDNSINSDNSFKAPSFYETSLRKYKTNITPYTDSALELLSKLKIVKYDKIRGPKDKIGIIADDSPKEFLSNELDSVDLYNTIFILAKAIQELKSKLDEKVTD